MVQVQRQALFLTHQSTIFIYKVYISHDYPERQSSPTNDVMLASNDSQQYLDIYSHHPVRSKLLQFLSPDNRIRLFYVDLTSRNYYELLHRKEDLSSTLLSCTYHWKFNGIRIQNTVEEEFKQNKAILERMHSWFMIISMKCRFITVLQIREMFLNDHSMEIIAKCDWRFLSELDFHRNFIGWRGVQCLASLRLHFLKTFVISSNNIKNKGLTCICKAPWPQLESLGIADTGITTDGLSRLKKARFDNISVVEMNEHEMTTRDLKSFLSITWSPLVTEEDLQELMEPFLSTDRLRGAQYDIFFWANLMPKMKKTHQLMRTYNFPKFSSIGEREDKQIKETLRIIFEEMFYFLWDN